MNLYISIVSLWLISNMALFIVAEPAESIVRPLQETEGKWTQIDWQGFKSLSKHILIACRYKVWYLEVCDPVKKVQVVHLILAEGGNNCEVVRHLTKECVPSQENDHPVMPEKAVFKELLLSKNHTLEALEETLNHTASFYITELKNYVNLIISSMIRIQVNYQLC